jgi:hypothetical protein
MLPFGDTRVVCIACGERVARADAREYDRFGDRFDRRGKCFEYLCEGCDAELCHHPRTGVEQRLCAIEQMVTSRTELLGAFLADPQAVDGQKD